MDRREELQALLSELARLTVLDDGNPQSFRARAYEKAALELRAAPLDPSSLSVANLQKLDGVGRGTAQKIREFYDTGRIAKLEKLRERFPPAVQRVAAIPGVGPRTLARLREELEVESVEDLRRAIERKQLRSLQGLGARSEERIAKAIDRLGLAGKDQRLPIAEAMPVARRLVAALMSLSEVESALYCGSLRRLRPTIADVDILIASTSPEAVAVHFPSLPGIRDAPGTGETRTAVFTDRGLQVDLRIVRPDQLGAASLYFTGSKAHNIRLRQRAIARGWTLNEYALQDAATGRVIAARTEEEIYAALELAWVPPPMREDTGELEAAAEGALPDALLEEHLQGDLHVHTDLSGDGRSAILDVLARAASRGYGYLAITDHAEDLAVAGVGREPLLAQRAELRALQARFPQMRLLHGVELNIGAEGGLDYDAAFRGDFDWCVAAVHSHFDLDRDAQTRRVLAAMEDPAVNAIGHLSGRLIGRRPGIELDIDAVLEGAARTGTAIEINSALPRLDAAWEVLRRARDRGVTFAVSSDAHHCDELERMQWGARQAQRGWVDRDRIANTWPMDRFLAWVAEGRSARPV